MCIIPKDLQYYTVDMFAISPNLHASSSSSSPSHAAFDESSKARASKS